MHLWELGIFDILFLPTIIYALRGGNRKVELFFINVLAVIFILFPPMWLFWWCLLAVAFTE